MPRYFRVVFKKEDGQKPVMTIWRSSNGGTQCIYKKIHLQRREYGYSMASEWVFEIRMYNFEIIFTMFLI